MRLIVEQKDDATTSKDIKKEAFLNKLLFNTIDKIKEIAQSGIFKHPTGTYANSISGYILDDDIVVYSSVTYAKAIEFGVRPHQMWYLLNRTVPIKVWAPGAVEPDIIFRKVTLESLLAGGWTHPGTPPKYVMRQGIEESLKDVPKLRAEVFRG